MVTPATQPENSGKKIPVRKTILIVDDEEMTRDVLAQALNIMGFNSISAENGVVAFELVKKNKLDLVITDIHMPRMNGLELLREVKAYDPDLPVILITGFDAEETRLAAKEHEASALITKPFRLNQLGELMNNIFSESVKKD